MHLLKLAHFVIAQACIYGLSTMAIRANIQKIIGGTPKGVGSPFDQLTKMTEEKED
jgi:hypothetical protein